MSQFYAYDFIFDGIPSHTFDLKIVSFEDGGLFSGVGSSDVEIYTQRVLRKSKPYYLGRVQQPVLEFPLTFASANPISGMDRDIISAWLFGRSSYKKLEILQDDLNGAWFNCFMTKPEPQYIGNLNYAFKCQVTCDSPFAYSFQKTHIYSNPSVSGSTTETFTIYNNSSEDDYLYPVLNFKTNDHVEIETKFFNITNLSEPTSASPTGRLTSFTKLSTDNIDPPGILVPDEVTADMDMQTISNTGRTSTADILTNFNKTWFRLIPKENQIKVESNCSYYSISYYERMKIGG